MDLSSNINENELRIAIALLQALRDPRRSDHVIALRSLDTNTLQPSFILHILHIFAHGSKYDASYGISTDIRQLAGLIIKNYVFPHLTGLSSDLQQYIKKELMNILCDPLSDLRKTAAILIGKISESFFISFWLDMLPIIIDNLTIESATNNSYLFDGCLHAIHRICEDSSVKLSLSSSENDSLSSTATVPTGFKPLDILVPRLLILLQQCNDSSVKIRCLESYNCLLYLLESPNSISVGGLRSRNT
jgi:hypothetical protein